MLQNIRNRIRVVQVSRAEAGGIIRAAPERVALPRFENHFRIAVGADGNGGRQGDVVFAPGQVERVGFRGFFSADGAERHGFRECFERSDHFRSLVSRITVKRC